MDKAIQAKHITTEQFLAAIVADQAEGWSSTDGAARTFTCHHSTAQSIARRLGVPVKVVCAKITKLDRQKVIEGCGCGCGSPIWVLEEVV